MYTVTSCAMKRMYESGGGTKYDPRIHTLIECRWLKRARRQTHRPDLLIYHHKWSRNFCLAHWISRPGHGGGPGYFLDLEVLDGGHPDKNPAQALGMPMVRARLRPMDEIMKERDRRERSSFARHAHELEESERQRLDVAKWLLGKGPRFETAAYNLKTGEDGYIGDNGGGGKEAEGLMEFFRSLR